MIFRGLVAEHDAVRDPGVTVLLKLDDEASTKYQEKYFGEMKLQVFWGDAFEFTGELWRRWTERHGDS